MSHSSQETLAAPEASDATPFVRGFILNNLTEYIPDGYSPGPLLAALWVDPRTEVQAAGSLEKFVIIIGSCIPTHPAGKQTAEALFEVLQQGEHEFYEHLGGYTGRYAIIYGNQETIKVVNDATAMRSIFYAAAGGIVASHALLVEQALGGVIRKSDMPFRYGFPGNGTPYRRTKLLTANTSYNVATNQVTRFWPTREIADCTVDHAAVGILDQTVRAIQNMAEQRPLKLALTAGLDSRTMLAVMLHSGVEFETYTYGVGSDTLRDRNFAKDLAAQVGIEHSVIERVQTTPELLARLDQANYATHHKTTVASLAAWMDEATSAAVTANLLEIGRSFYQSAKQAGVEPPETPSALRNLHYRSTPSSAKKAVTEWGQDVYDHVATELFADFIDATGFQRATQYVDPFDLFYWEHRMSAWHGVAMVERDYYAEPFIPFNARAVFELMLGVPEEQRKTSEVFYTIINMVAPELLELPINPTSWPLEL